MLYGAIANVIWGGVLGFDLADRATRGTFVGWRVTEDVPDRYMMEVAGSRMTGRMVFARTSTGMEWTTMLRFDRATARVVWSAVGRSHREIAPRSLAAARRRLER